MYGTNPQINLERRKELEREAKNERLARSAQNQEKTNILRNALNAIKALSNDEPKR
jgi:hypothetical protein